MANVLLNANGINPTITDSDGYYTIANLAANTYSVTPLLYGYSFSELFNNSVAVGPNYVNADFEAESLPLISITAPETSATEGNSIATGTFRLTRTGSTANSLTVNINPAIGTASTSDYSLSPALAGGSGGFSTFTIPADSSTLDIVLNAAGAANDTAAEGQETISFALAAGAGYLIAPNAGSATVQIEDDDTTLPKISLTVVKDSTEENGSTPASIRISRTGSTSSSITVAYSTSGTATASDDYHALGTNVLIPANQSSVTVNVSMLQDTLVEPLETLTLKLTSQPSYVLDSSASSGTVQLVDDDTNVVTLSIADNTAQEVDLSVSGNLANTANYIVTRTGDTSAPLTVYYSLSGNLSSGVAALHGVDFEALPGVLTIPAGSDTASIVILPRWDNVGETTEQVQLQLGAGPTDYKLGSVTSGTVTIQDGVGNPSYIEVVGTTTAVEGDSSGIFNVSAKFSGTQTINIPFTLTGSAIAGTDYSVSLPSSPAGSTFDNTTGMGTLVVSGFSAIALTANITIIPTNDTALEDIEEIICTLGSSSSITTFGGQARIWLRDNDQPTVWTDSQVNTGASVTNRIVEGATTSPFKFYVSRTGSTSAALTVNFSLLGTATPGTDYNVSTSASVSFNNATRTGTLTIPASATGADLLLNTTGTNDTTLEGTETIVLRLENGSYSKTPDASIFMDDNDTSGANAVTFPTPGGQGAESVTSVDVPVNLTTASVGVTTVDYSVATGTRGSSSGTSAVPSLPYWIRLRREGNVFTGWRSGDGVNWTQTSTSRNIALGLDAQVGLAVCARSDGQLATAVFDNVRVNNVAVTDLTGRTIGYVNAQGSDSLANDTYTIKGSGAQIGGTEDECHFVAKTLTGDFDLDARVVSITGGASSAQAGLMARELHNNRSLNVYSGITASLSHEFISRSSSTTNAFGSGVDFSLANGTLTFNDGESSKNILLSINDDSIVEPNESVVVRLTNPTASILGTNVTYTYVIDDNDVATTVPLAGFSQAAASIVESSPGNYAAIITLSEAASSSVSVDYTVTGGSATLAADYNLNSGTLTFSPGDSTKIISIGLLDDNAVESAETIILSLSNPVGCLLTAQTTHTLTLTDDDLPVVTLTANDSSASEITGNEGQFTLTRTGPTGSALTVSLTSSGTATSGTDYTALGGTATIPSGASSVTLNVSPVDDTTNEGTEMVRLSISTNAAYTLGTPSSATVNIEDNDRSLFSIQATDAVASETAGNTATFRISRTGALNTSINVTLSYSGTAINNTDYTATASPLTFNTTETEKFITIIPTNDSASEGDETVVLSISGSIGIDGINYASVMIQDNDYAPQVSINSPSADGILVASGQGIILTGIATDDGAPTALSTTWSQVSGPGVASFSTPTAQSSAVSFSADGVYLLRLTATDTQFTSSAETVVIVGSAITAADWIAQDMSPTTQQRGLSARVGTSYVLTGMGAGYAATNDDAAHTMTRQVNGDGSITAKLSSITGTATNQLAGVTIRDSLNRSVNRAVLGYSGGSLQFRTRTSVTTNDNVTTVSGVSLPVWLKLDRINSSGTITASYAPDINGTPGSWTVIGSPSAITMLNSITHMGLTATNNSTSNTLTSRATFDDVSLTPAPTGEALISENFGTTPSTQASFSVSGSTYTVAAADSMDSNGAFYGWQYTGDFILTAKQLDATSGALNAKSGIHVRESMDKTAGFVQFGRITTSSFSGYTWRTVAGGSTGGVPSFTAKIRWMRLVRDGNRFTAFHAPDSAGAPGTWVQVGSPRTIVMPPRVLLGLAVDNQGGAAGVLNTAQFSNLSVVPLNKAPNIIISATNDFTPINLDASVTDDSVPQPTSLTTEWSQLTGPSLLSFNNPSLVDTTAALTLNGSYQVRLQADDSAIITYRDYSFNAYLSPFAKWLETTGTGDGDQQILEATQDADADGLMNLLEFATGTNGIITNTNPQIVSYSSVSGNDYLRLSIPKNPAATDVIYTIEASSDLTTWSSAGLITEINTANQLQVRDYIPVNATAKRFMRVKVVRM